MLELFNIYLRISGSEITGLSISIKGFDKHGNVNQNYKLQAKIDSALESNNMQSINTVANTIFPINLWNPEYSRNTLYERYNNVLKHIKRCPLNRYGIYFERMINFKNGVNQLEKTIAFYKSGNLRRSAYQIAIWDPLRDLTNTRMRGFPCMQHLVFLCVRNRLVVIGFFATQYLFERAYGNFLGLCNLGKFMSHELGIPLCEVKCYVGVELLNIPKTNLSKILRRI